MADLARIARPWLFSLRQPIRTPTASLGFSHRISTTACRPNTKRARAVKASQNARRAQKDKAMQVEAMSSFLLPLTIVPPPIWRYPRSPAKFAHMLWLLGKNRLQTWGSLAGIYFMSARTKGLIGWPLFRARRAACIPAAKALHQQMSEAAAAGDKDTLRRVCTSEWFQTLAGAIDARPPGQRAEWELVRYDHRLRYPRLADFRVTYQPAASSSSAGGMKLVKQAVVSISSVQRLARFDDRNGGAVVPGSRRERPMLEHVVLQAEINPSTFQAEPWKIWGNLPEMPYETIRDDAIIFQEAMANPRRS
ncbi:hypothetical protein F5Y19DRAFT_471827 [Xylariaceae sp. FL1651]|nr:hypothetical protein F5Y19DRAFT_471827 [Xylariaceae sp. FL1651]